MGLRWNASYRRWNGWCQGRSVVHVWWMQQIHAHCAQVVHWMCCVRLMQWTVVVVMTAEKTRLNFWLDIETVHWSAQARRDSTHVVMMLQREANIAAAIRQNCSAANWSVALLCLLAILSTAILEPDFHLTLRQIQRLRQFGFAPDRNVMWHVVFFLEFQTLVVSVNYAIFILCTSLSCEWK